MEKNWRIPSITRYDGEIIKIWQPKMMDYERAEFLMKMFNERGIKARLENGLTTKSDIKLVMRRDRGSKTYNENVYRMLAERPTVEAKGEEWEFNAFERAADSAIS